MGNRIKTQVMKEIEAIKKSKKDGDSRPMRHAISEHLGQGTSALAAMLLGGTTGALVGVPKSIGSDDPVSDRILGGLLGVAAGGFSSLGLDIIGKISAAIRRRRTAKEQIEHDKKSVILNYLVPGFATYNHHKRLGRSQGDIEENDVNHKSRE